MTGSTATVTTTNPFGYCFVSYRRTRLAEVGALVRALHELGVPTWQDLHDLDERPLEATLRSVLADPNIASGVLWITPEVAHSAIITDIEVPGLAGRATHQARSGSQGRGIRVVLDRWIVSPQVPGSNQTGDTPVRSFVRAGAGRAGRRHIGDWCRCD